VCRTVKGRGGSRFRTECPSFLKVMVISLTWHLVIEYADIDFQLKGRYLQKKLSSNIIIIFCIDLWHADEQIDGGWGKGAPLA
jgi:hypothetical protein